MYAQLKKKDDGQSGGGQRCGAMTNVAKPKKRWNVKETERQKVPMLSRYGTEWANPTTNGTNWRRFVSRERKAIERLRKKNNRLSPNDFVHSGDVDHSLLISAKINTQVRSPKI